MLIDVTRLADRHLKGRFPTGVDRVSLAYLEYFGRHSAALVRFAGRWLELSHRDSQRLFDALVHSEKSSESVIRHCIARACVTPWKRRASMTYLFNTGHSGLDLPDYPVRIRRRGLNPVYFLHDLIPISHPEYCRAGEADKHRRRLETMLSTGKGLIVNSQATLDALLAHAEVRKIPLPPCTVAFLAPGRLPVASARRPMDEPYFVVLGTIEPRKNHLLLLHIWRSLVETMGGRTPRLVIIGQRGWECEQVVDLLDRCEALKGIVLEKTGFDDQALVNYLAHAQALLFPSFIEGFGIPLIEALMLQVPVIASNLPVFHEIAGDIPDYLDPLDGFGWRGRILDFMPFDSSVRQAQVGRMQGYRPPTWAGHFERVEDLLKRCRAS